MLLAAAGKLLDKIAPSLTLAKATLCSVDEKYQPDQKIMIKIQFNPSELTIQRNSEITEKEAPLGESKPVRPPVSGKAGYATMSMTLYYDARTFSNGSLLDEALQVTGAAEIADDLIKVKKFANEMNGEINKFELLTRKTNGIKSPLVRFVWGSISFVGVVSSSSIRYTMFDNSGIPIRAEIDLTLEGDNTKEFINKSSTSEFSEIKDVALKRQLTF